jgi:hypothetical protein
LKLYRIITILIFAFFFANNSYSQTDTSRNIFSGQYVITGNVSDSTGKYTLPGASLIMNRIHTTDTDEYGNFKLLLPAKYANKNFSILIGCVGFAALKIKIRNKQSTFTKELNIHLKAAVPDMNTPVTICCN